MPQRVFLDWSLPLLPALTDWLLPAVPEAGAPDLSQTVVIVPTAAAGRRLRRALAEKAGETGLLSPQVVTPEVLISWSLPDGVPVATRGATVTAWASVLAELDLAQWRALFPVDPVSQDAAWAVQAAGDLLRLRRTLEEGGRTLEQAAAVLTGSGNPEPERWQSLARLERLATTRLETGGWRDSPRIRLAAAREPRLPEGAHRVVAAGLPDSIALTRLALEAVEAQGLAEVVVVIHAPEALGETFDAWGRPLPEVWTTREIRLPRGNRSISLTSRPEDGAALLLEHLQAASGDSEGGRVIGSADPETAAPLGRLAAAAEVAVFDPEGQPLMEHEVSWLLRTLTALLHTGAWTTAGQLLRIPDVLKAAGEAARAKDGLRLLREWDEFQAERLPQTMRQAAPLATRWAEETHARKAARSAAETAEMPVLPAVLAWLEKMSERLKRGPLGTALEALLETVYGHRHFTTGAERQRFAAALTAWQEAVESVEQGAVRFLPALTAAARLDLAASLVRDARLYTAHDDDAQALHGWLELPWQDAPHLMIAGMNEGLVPDSIQGDAWLPDSVRGRLDLKTNDIRLARDSYLLSAMTASRRDAGSVRLTAARQSSEGEPLKPSRLLLRCPMEDLPERALHLFPKEPEETGVSAPPWRRAWSLAVPPPEEEAPVFRRLSVTAFADYLKCPFRFYLKHVLGMEEYDGARAELDARAFGSLFHDTMQDLHLDPSLRDSTDPAALTGFLLAAADRRIEAFYGSHLTIPVAVQMDTLRGCLTKAAELHAAERAAGWRFEQVEIDFPRLPDSELPVTIDGMEIRGRIDLIEHHMEKGYRILDYKTSATAVIPAKAHLMSLKSAGDLPDWRLAETPDGRLWSWQNLQLPLYARIMSRHYGKKVAAGYVNLPRAISEARVEMWDGLDEALLASAENCAKGVIAGIRAARFWPPAEKIKYDDFKALIFGDIGSSFDPRQLEITASMAASGQFRPAT